MLKKVIVTVFLAMFSVSVFAVEPTLEQKQALFMMNYAQYVTHKLKTYNNILALEDEYNNLNDNMNFQTILDDESVWIINDLLDKIHTERENNKNREHLEIAVERKMNSTLYNSIPNLTTIVAGNANPLSLAINAATVLGSSFMGYQRYKSELSNEFDEKMFEFQKLTESNLNTLYQELNSYTFNLMRNYVIADEWRLNQKELEDIFKYLKDSDKNRVFTNLKNMSEGRYVQHFPMFWYHLAKAAYDAGKEDEALKYFTRFEKENIEIFRYDRTAVDAYKIKISILLKNKQANKKEILSKLQFIEKNKISWSDYYFCTLVYIELGDKDNAIRLLERNINELETEVYRQYSDGSFVKALLRSFEVASSGVLGSVMNTKESASTSIKSLGSPEYDGLEMCRATLNQFYGNGSTVIRSIINMYHEGIQSDNEVLCLIGFNSAHDFHNVYLTTKIYSEKTYQVDVKIPLQWVLSTNTDVVACFKSSSTNKTLSFRLHIDENELKKLLKSNDLNPSSTMISYSTGKFDLNWKKDKMYFDGILLDHKMYPVRFRYSLEIQRPVRDISPSSIIANGQKTKL